MAVNICVEYNCYIFHDIDSQKAFSVSNIYDEVDEQYVDSAIHMQIRLSLTEDHNMDEETMMVHSYCKMLEVLMNTNNWYSFSALYSITIKIEVLAHEIQEQPIQEDLEAIDVRVNVNANNGNDAETDEESNNDSAYETENDSSDGTEMNETDESLNTSSCAYYSNSSYLESNDTESESDENMDEDYELEDYDIIMVEIDEEQSIVDADIDTDDDTEADKNYFENYKYYKTV